MMKGPARSTLILAVSSLVIVLLPSALISAGIIDAYLAQVITIGGVNAILAVSVNMITGITGQLSIGQAGFMAIGAYATIFFNLDAGLPLPLAALIAALVTAFTGFLIGFPTLKLSGDYLAIVTLGFGEIIRVILVNLRPLTGGANGRQFTTPLAVYSDLSFFTVTAALVTLLLLLRNFMRSSYGRAILAVREDEIAANAAGIHIFRYKMIGFVTASFIAGLGGGLFAMVIGFVKPDVASFNKSIDYLIFVVLGGMGSLTGSVLAAYVLTYLQEFLRFLQDYRLLIYPFLLIFVMLFRPQGLIGMKEISIARLLGRAARFYRARKEAGRGK
jgi:branched-chain amino acid transport system permease protein